jgi:chemotaxis protein CheC
MKIPISGDLLRDDILQEVFNVGIGDAANALSMLVKSPVKIRVPEITVIEHAKLAAYVERELADIGVFISQQFGGSISGQAILAYSDKCSKSLLSAIMDVNKDIKSLAKIEISTLEEIGNLVIVSCLSTISDMIKNPISFSMPIVSTSGAEKFFCNLAQEIETYEQCIVAKNKMEVKEMEIEGYIFISLSFADINIIVNNLYSEQPQ